ncbi:hypothetical protein F1D05_12265 [Kribbella qitaiheensis]|uniref:Uncharacterized protein n=1 Tax=Kribbella qitaiheensis TaxID=1544730 RepID=A0A7G6X9I3_9ACTN|nr:hypothetical protein F1D05_12265 [Kribbella qitaiheensis]
MVLAGCGDETNSGSAPTTPPPSTPSTSTPGTPTSGPSSTRTSDAMPLTVTRSGGFAGFDDRVVLGADGIASVSSRGGNPVHCKVETGLFNTVIVAVGQVDWASVGTTKPTIKHPDDMIIAVSAGGALARLEDPKVKPMVTPVGRLLTEATSPKLCKPV